MQKLISVVHVMHDRGCIIIDPPIYTKPGQSTSGIHRLGCDPVVSYGPCAYIYISVYLISRELLASITIALSHLPSFSCFAYWLWLVVSTALSMTY